MFVHRLHHCARTDRAMQPEVTAWLEEQRFGDFVEFFAQQKVKCLDHLQDVDDETLSSMGMLPVMRNRFRSIVKDTANFASRPTVLKERSSCDVRSRGTAAGELHSLVRRGNAAMFDEAAEHGMSMEFTLHFFASELDHIMSRLEGLHDGAHFTTELADAVNQVLGFPIVRGESEAGTTQPDKFVELVEGDRCCELRILKNLPVLQQLFSAVVRSGSGADGTVVGTRCFTGELAEAVETEQLHQRGRLGTGCLDVGWKQGVFLTRVRGEQASADSVMRAGDKVDFLFVNHRFDSLCVAVSETVAHSRRLSGDFRILIKRNFRSYLHDVAVCFIPAYVMRNGDTIKTQLPLADLVSRRHEPPSARRPVKEKQMQDVCKYLFGTPQFADFTVGFTVERLHIVRKYLQYPCVLGGEEMVQKVQKGLSPSFDDVSADMHGFCMQMDVRRFVNFGAKAPELNLRGIIHETKPRVDNIAWSPRQCFCIERPCTRNTVLRPGSSSRISFLFSGSKANMSEGSRRLLDDKTNLEYTFVDVGADDPPSEREPQYVCQNGEVLAYCSTAQHEFHRRDTVEDAVQIASDQQCSDISPASWSNEDMHPQEVDGSRNPSGLFPAHVFGTDGLPSFGYVLGCCPSSNSRTSPQNAPLCPEIAHAQLMHYMPGMAMHAVDTGSFSANQGYFADIPLLDDHVQAEVLWNAWLNQYEPLTREDVERNGPLAAEDAREFVARACVHLAGEHCDDEFGSMLLTKAIMIADPTQLTELARTCKQNDISEMSSKKFGSRVVQAFFDQEVSQHVRSDFARMLTQNSMKLNRIMRNMYGNYVVAKIVERWDEESFEEPVCVVLQELKKDLFFASKHKFMHRPLLRFIEQYSSHEDILNPVMDFLNSKMTDLIKRAIGKAVVQYMVAHGRDEDRAHVFDYVAENFLEVATNTHACPVVDMCFVFLADQCKQAVGLAKQRATDQLTRLSSAAFPDDASVDGEGTPLQTVVSKKSDTARVIICHSTEKQKQRMAKAFPMVQQMEQKDPAKLVSPKLIRERSKIGEYSMPNVLQNGETWLARDSVTRVLFGDASTATSSFGFGASAVSRMTLSSRESTRWR
eukprot:TRINITY_DN26210_c0_g1_i1.p1 TRINITY_DN26210_c0_g1~~TRINITY_DN26210_c0_g1_i1.p1  ORF type:complete len:1094 (-),score=197.15 TRINITY_DN26210_c0_g1_i1:59-3340(-)